MSWICNWCGAEFDEPEEAPYSDNLGEIGVRRYTELLCPECGDDDIEEVW